MSHRLLRFLVPFILAGCGQVPPSDSPPPTVALGLTCPIGQTNCSGTCDNLKADLSNCGACGHACPAGNVCSAGVCALSCQAGLTNCGGICTNLKEDELNCGGCAKACAAGSVCTAGACVVSCQTGLTACVVNGTTTCTNTKEDELNCGGCGKPCAAGNVCINGACVLTCQAGLTVCTGTCTNLKTDVNNCGHCATKCLSGMVCSAGVCALSCQAALTKCGGTCVNAQTDVNNCGGCGFLCGTGFQCVSGKCTVSCGVGLSNCSNACTNLKNDPGNCGACGINCGSGSVCLAGSCQQTCQALTNCNGACTNLLTDNGNCGACGSVCPPGSVCSNGGCTVSCQAQQTNCNASCVNFQNDNANCGACNAACAAGQVCSNGACALSCQQGLTNCGGTCSNLPSDNAHCGDCNTLCGPGSACTNGSCVLTCQPGLTNCGGNCTSLQSDYANCGACNGACASGQVCSNGACGLSCQPGLTNCSGTCSNFQSDNAHCGSCNTVCGPGSACTNGACLITCQPGLTLCGGNCNNLNSDDTNCGACGVACPVGTACMAGGCAVSCGPGLTSCNNACTSTQYDPSNCGACGAVCPSGDACVGGVCAALIPVTLVLNPGSAWSGSSIAATGGGFAPFEQVAFYWNGNANTGVLIGTAFADGNGNTSGSLLVPAAPPGAYPIYAIGASSHRSANANLNVIASTLTLNPATGPRGKSFTATASNFAPNELVSFYWNGDANTGHMLNNFSPGQADGNGNVTLWLWPRAAAPGPYPVYAIGHTSHQSASAIFTMQSGTLTANPVSGTVGTSVLVSTSAGFQDGETVYLYWNGDATTGTKVSQSVGMGANTGDAYFGAFKVPATAPGTYLLYAYGGASHATATTTFTVVATGLYLNPPSGYSGMKAHADASFGFKAFEHIRLYWNGDATTGTFLKEVTSTSGDANISYTVPVAPLGTYPLYAIGTQSGAVATATFTLVTGVGVLKVLTLAPTSGNSGTQVTATSFGYTPNEVVTLYWNGDSNTGVAESTALADGNGNVSLTMTVPAVAPTSYVVYAIGATSNNAARGIFAVFTERVTLNFTSGVPGTHVTATCTGYTPNGTVDLYWDSKYGGGLQTSGVADGSGNVTLVMTVPPSAPGPYDISAWDATVTSQISASAPFTVVSGGLTLNHPFGVPGSQITATSPGFGPNEIVSLYWNGDASNGGVLLTSSNAGVDGTVGLVANVPAAAPGAYQLVAVGATSQATANGTFTVVSGTLTLNPATGASGIQVTATAGGFAPNETVNLYWNGDATSGALQTSAPADASGNASLLMTVPAAAAGAYPVYAVGATSKSSANASFTVVVPAPNLIALNWATTDLGGGTIQFAVDIKNIGNAPSVYMAYAFLATLPGGSYGGSWAPTTGPIQPGQSVTFTSTAGGGWTKAALVAGGGQWKVVVDPSGVNQTPATFYFANN